jgi:integrase
VSRPRIPRLQLPPHVHCTSSKGRQYYSFHPFRGTKRAGVRVRLPGYPTNTDGTPNAEWWAAYRAASGMATARPGTGTFTALIGEYQESPEWKELALVTRKEWKRHLRLIEASWGDLQVVGVEPKHVLKLRDSRASTPADANNLLRTLSALFTWCALRGWRSDNPCRLVPKLKIGDGWAPWPWDAIDHFRQFARGDLWEAAALALYTGQRLSDVLVMGWSDIEGRLISVVQSKTGKRLWIPIHRELREVLIAIEARRRSSRSENVVALPGLSGPILTNSRGRAWTRDGFKGSWQNELNRTEMSALRERRLVFHGLRKSAVVFLLEAGCSDAETAAITGQSRDMVEHYAKQVNQKRLAAAAILKWEAADAARTQNAEGAEFVQPSPDLVQLGRQRRN